MTDLTLTHPDSKQTVKVAREHAEAFTSQGWQEKSAAKPAKKAAARKTASAKKAVAPTTDDDKS